MKRKKIKIIILTSEQIKARMLNAFEGKKRSVQDADEIVFASPESFTKILTANRIEILMYLTNHRPRSIYELAKSLKRDFKNVHTDVKKLAEMSLIDLEPSEEARKGLVPCAKYSGIDLNLAA